MLPKGTTVVKPDAEPRALPSTHYLLTRPDVEKLVQLRVDLKTCQDQQQICEDARKEPPPPPHQESAGLLRDVLVYGGGALLIFAAGYGTAELVRAVD